MKKFKLFTSAYLFMVLIFLLVITPKHSCSAKNNFIKWVDFNADYETLRTVYELDKKYYGENKDADFITMLSYLALKNGNNFDFNKDKKNIQYIKNEIDKGNNPFEKVADNKYFKYYKETYTAIFSQFFGEYKKDGKEQYGLKAYFPLASGYWYTHYNDFGNSRSYGFKRKHLGHDIMGGIGTPVVAIEGGTVYELGWNMYGGWRIGINSFDGKRYYYYAHLRRNRPFASDINLGGKVEAGQVIGYLGNTGYSHSENQNLKSGQPHLHIGLQIIFDESQRDCNSEIWIDMYSLTKFLTANKAKVIKCENGEYVKSD